MTTVDPSSVPRLAVGRTWEEMPVGFAFRTAARTLTETDVMTFVTLAGLNEPLFLDARQGDDSAYVARPVPGSLTFAVAEGLVVQTNVMHGTAMAFLHMELDIRKPVYVGHTIEVVVEITAARETSRGGSGILTARNTVLNQDGETVMEYEPVRMVRGRP